MRNKIAKYRVIRRSGKAVARFYTRVYVSIETLSADGKRCYVNGTGLGKSPFLSNVCVGISHYRSGLSRRSTKRLLDWEKEFQKLVDALNAEIQERTQDVSAQNAEARNAAF